MPAMRTTAKEAPAIQALADSIHDLCEGHSFQTAADALFSCFSEFAAQALVATEEVAGAAEGRVDSLVGEYAEMLKQTVLVNVLDHKKGSRS